MNIGQILKNNIVLLKKNKNIESPRLDAELLLSNIIHRSLEFIITHPEHILTQSQISKFKSQISKRIEGVPVAYILSYKEFYGYKFKVNKNVLIPRPETELMIDEILSRVSLPGGRHGNFQIIDIGTGSGCIAVSTAKEIEKIENRHSGIPHVVSQKSKIEILAFDISKKALNIAKQNAQLHNVDKKIKFRQGNLLTPLLKNLEIRNCNLVISANLPYLTPLQIKNSVSIKKEPKLALDGGVDGLQYYKKLFKQIKKIKNNNIIVFCEIDPSQKTKFIFLLKKIFPKIKYKLIKDLKGHNRLIKISKI